MVETLFITAWLRYWIYLTECLEEVVVKVVQQSMELLEELPKEVPDRHWSIVVAAWRQDCPCKWLPVLPCHYWSTLSFSGELCFECSVVIAAIIDSSIELVLFMKKKRAKHWHLFAKLFMVQNLADPLTSLESTMATTTAVIEIGKAIKLVGAQITNWQ